MVLQCLKLRLQYQNAEYEIVGRRIIVLRRRDLLNSDGTENLDTIWVTYRSYDPLSYVPFVPHGQEGWHIQLAGTTQSHTRSEKITPATFYLYHLHIILSILNIMHRGCGLFRKYTLAQFYKVESERLSYLRQVQQNLRAADYTSLCEQLGDPDRVVIEA